ncbi:MAG: hypothetical protein IC227_06295 [Enterococcus lacertideformus]|uniref:Uncharacterized protein n=1 Tax=Enterococcus lacertideformus TaxID=2771493 RepID=A0A931AVS7_9ENTE|nr:hypothetical protein [Enterococcus lacertideformus]
MEWVARYNCESMEKKAKLEPQSISNNGVGNAVYHASFVLWVEESDL